MRSKVFACLVAKVLTSLERGSIEDRVRCDVSRRYAGFMFENCATWTTGQRPSAARLIAMARRRSINLAKIPGWRITASISELIPSTIRPR